MSDKGLDLTRFDRFTADCMAVVALPFNRFKIDCPSAARPSDCDGDAAVANSLEFTFKIRDAALD